jgi:hypothetical protein
VKVVKIKFIFERRQTPFVKQPVERQDNNQAVFMEIVLDIGSYPAYNEKKEGRLVWTHFPYELPS